MAERVIPATICLHRVRCARGLLGNVSDAVKQSYIERIDWMEAEYQKAGASGSFNAGVEGGKLVTDIAILLAGGTGVVKGDAGTHERGEYAGEHKGASGGARVNASSGAAGGRQN